MQHVLFEEYFDVINLRIKILYVHVYMHSFINSGLSPGEFEGTTVKELVRLRKCPAYVLPSSPVLGRCVPTFGLTRSTASELSLVRNLKR